MLLCWGLSGMIPSGYVSMYIDMLKGEYLNKADYRRQECTLRACVATLYTASVASLTLQSRETMLTDCSK